MRCKACNVNLNDLESTRRYANSGDFVDLCNRCHKWLPEDVNTVTNPEHEELEFDVDDELAAITNADLFDGWETNDDDASRE